MKPTIPENGDLRADLAYSKLVRDIEQAVAAGSLKPGDRLPSEVRLKKQYGISINSIRRGMDGLARQGLLQRRRGSGTYVRSVPEPAPVSRERPVILLANAIEHLPTHPFFGERKRALVGRLAEWGWKVESFIGDEWPDNEQRPVVWHNVDLPRLLRRIGAQDRSPAGVITDRATVEPVMRAAQGRLPCVCLAPNACCPFVEYDWEDELTRAIDLASGTGARVVGLIGSRSERDPTLLRNRKACAARGIALLNAVVEPGVHSRVMHEACEAARTMLRSRKGRPDAIVMESDIHAQGVFDALAENDPAKISGIRLMAFVNKESRLHTALPYTALVADGALAGSLLADLLHESLTEPDRTAASIYLRCTLRLARTWPRMLPGPNP